MSIANEKKSDVEFEPRTGPIVGSILGVIAWLAFIVVYALFWSKSFDIFQNIIVTIVSLIITGLVIGAVWLIWYHPTGELRSRFKKEKEIIAQ